MNSTTSLKISSSSSSSFSLPFSSSSSSHSLHIHTNSSFPLRTLHHRQQPLLILASSSINASISPQADSHAVDDSHRRRSSLESLFCYDKAIPEEIIEKPTGLSLAEKNIGDKVRCSDCEAKGAVLCATCSGSGLYLDSILESQGIMVKVRCLGCGGSGNIMCSDCGGRGHIGVV
ncbi:Protein EMBRYO SAC DEVELOPMENT ARREST 3 [Heracleum sosnowskyi]|uniref:Protein EMBRYO SAC DEVELOPMENT ARREST 3 n=1 Tax=Heracleum sosnowskyi TaxID=360622 RepID=A0AAD8HGD2_9APIA|nr:Protein EMBRYO SAC DEVELOPMENT ARREST 3 [Heracleum sosnowskyi]